MEGEPLHAWFLAIQQAAQDLHTTVSINPEYFFEQFWRNTGYLHIRINTPVGQDPFQPDLQAGFNYLRELDRHASIIPPAVPGYIITLLANTDPDKNPQAPTLILLYQNLQEFTRLVARPNTSVFRRDPDNPLHNFIRADYILTEFMPSSVGPYVHRPFSTILDMGRPSIADNRLHLVTFKNSFIHTFRMNDTGFIRDGCTFTPTPLTMTDIQKEFLYTPVIRVAEEHCKPNTTLIDLASYNNIWMMILVLFADHAQKKLKRDFKGIQYTLANAFPSHGNPFKLFADFLTQSNTSLHEFNFLWTNATHTWYGGHRQRSSAFLLGGVVDTYMHNLSCVTLPRHGELVPNSLHTKSHFPGWLDKYINNPNPTTSIRVIPRLYSSRTPHPHHQQFLLPSLMRYFHVDGFAYIPRATRKVGEWIPLFSCLWMVSFYLYLVSQAHTSTARSLPPRNSHQKRHATLYLFDPSWCNVSRNVCTLWRTWTPPSLNAWNYAQSVRNNSRESQDGLLHATIKIHVYFTPTTNRRFLVPCPARFRPSSQIRPTVAS